MGQRSGPDPHASLLLSGLIIDAFGELRDQQEQVKEDMEVSHAEDHPEGWMKGPPGARVS